MVHTHHATNEEPPSLTPASHGVFPTRHHVLALLVLPGDHLKLYAGVSHPMVSAVESDQDVSTRWGDINTRVCVCVCSSSPFKALVENLIGRQQPGLVGQLVDPGVLDTDVVKILTETDGHSSSNCVVQITIKKKKQGGDTPPVRRPLLASPPTSASQSRGWGSPVWLGLQGTTERSHDKGHTTTVTWQHRCGSHSFWQDVKIYT